MTQATSPLAFTALASGNLPEAERLCRAYLAQSPDDENHLIALAISLQMQGRIDEAIAFYRQLVGLFPQSSLHWHNYATSLHGAGSDAQAEEAWIEAIRLDPRNIEPKIQYGLLLLAHKRYPEAREALLDAFDLDKSNARARIHAARACCQCQDFQGAEDLLKPWRAWLPLNDDALQLELAELLQLMSNGHAALALLEDITSRNPAKTNARLMLAQTYERSNRLEDARKTTQALIADGSVLDDGVANEVDHLLAGLSLRSGRYEEAAKLLGRRGPRHPGDYTHFFELAEARDKAGDPDSVLDALKEAHRLQVAELAIASPEFFEAGAEALPAGVVRVSEESHRQWPMTIAPDAPNSPVFIVGFPRSGTTLLEQMLDAHPGLQSMDENPFFSRLAEILRRHDERILQNLHLLQQHDCDELRKRYLIMVSERTKRRWDAQLVDKNPLNMLWLPLMYRLFPQAKFVLAVRHPCDVILSCYMQNFRSSILGAACSTIERLAEAYVQAMQFWLEDVAMFKPNVFVSRYEDLVADISGQSRRLADFLELQDAGPMLEFDRHAREKGYIGTPSYSQVIEPVNTRGLGRWTRYRSVFEPVLPILEPMIRHWGYSTDADV
jgi:tetratricopeptide (TPR) repeat protein